ncbi:MAG TPA: OmpA family protein [Kofleriaceae bacterium]|nr:OmpA family protein [Kofleriaceae bacterium]
MSALKYLLLLAVLVARPASADPTSGVDAALFRSAYDPGGVFSLEGARLLPRHDLSFTMLLSYARSPLTLAVPGIGDTGHDRILDYLVMLDMAFGMSLSDRVEIGIDAAGYRTATGAGYGVRGRYGSGGQITRPSTGLISLRPLSNLDPSAQPGSSGYLGDELAGPLDARFGLKVALVQRPLWALTAVGSVFLPFGDDQMLLGDANFVFEPRLAFEWRRDRIHATRLVANLGARIRERTVLQAYDAMAIGQTPADAKVLLDVGSELVAGLGGVYELTPRVSAAAELVPFLPLPDGLSWGDCRLYSGARCTTLSSASYVAGAHHGDLAVQATGGMTMRVTPDVTANLMIGTSLTGARGDQIRITTGIVWAPQPGGGMAAGRADRDGDGIPDAIDQCPDEPEDKDGFQDEDGCPDPDNDKDGIPDAQDRCPNEPEDKDGFQDADGCPDPDNDHDGIPDAIDKCPDEAEDKDGFQDEDGCPDDDNDGDGFPDAVDKCPNDPETVNGFEDEDGCPDVRGTTGPEERADRIDLKGAQVTYARGALTAPARQLLGQVATLIKSRRLAIRIEVHTALGTRSTGAAQIAAQKRRDKTLAQQRAKLITDYLVSQGVPAPQLQAVGIGSDRPLGTATPTDPVNDRVDFIKAQQGGSP